MYEFCKKPFVLGRLLIVSGIAVIAVQTAGCASQNLTIDYKSNMVETLFAENWDCEEAVKSMAKNLDHPNWFVRKEAAEILGALHSRGCPAGNAVNGLKSLVKDRDENVRVAGVWALGIIFADGRSSDELQSVIKTLIDALNDKYWMVSMSAARSLSSIGREANSAIRALVDAGSDSNWWVRMYSLLGRKRIERAAEEQ